MPQADMIHIDRVDHIGVRVADGERAIDFYALFGFEVIERATSDAVVILRNATGVELNLIVNANSTNGGSNILMDEVAKYPGYTHLALRVESLRDTIAALKTHEIRITQGPVSFSRDGHVSVFVRDPDRNVIELRGRTQNPEEIEGLVQYDPKG